MRNETPQIIDICSTFDKQNATPKEISQSGAKLFKILYGGKVNGTLADLRRLMFSEKNATCKTGVKPEVLPPTYEAARQHSLRVFFQVSDWKCLGFDTPLIPNEWGWFCDDTGFHPIPCLQAPALQMIFLK